MEVDTEEKKVLLVDGDPQCNLTGIFFGDSFDEYYENNITKKMNIKDAVSDAFQGRPRPIEAIDCPTHRKNEDLYLIPGHMDLSEYESTLGLALNSNNAIITLQKYGKIKSLFISKYRMHLTYGD